MLSIMTTLIFLAISVAIAWLIYRIALRRQIERGEDGNIFAGLMIWAATCLGLGFAYTGLELVTGVDLPEPARIGGVYCQDGSIERIDGTCPCSEFDLRIRC